MKDLSIQGKYLVKIWSKIGWLVLRLGPTATIQTFRRYPWLKSITKLNALLASLVQNRTGPYREANALVIDSLITVFSEIIHGLHYRPHETVLHEDLVPPLIFYGMGLHPWCAEVPGVILPMFDSQVMEHYIDVAENEGIPPDVCSLPKNTIGQVLEKHMPQPIAIVTSNLPCDGGMTSYSIIERELNVPTFRLDIPNNFYDERAVDYFVGEMKNLIAWLEEHTPGKMDWDRMRELCEERNRAMEIELEIWDMIREKPTPMAAEPIYLSHLFFAYAFPCTPSRTLHFRKIRDLARKIRENGQSAIPDERFRVALWNTPTWTICPDMFRWAEHTYGVAMILDMLAYNRYPFIDTRTEDSMLRDISRIYMQGPMARHTRGPSENFIGDLFHIYEHLSLDMVWMGSGIGCKNTQALIGMLREKCRERDIPLLLIDHDVSDARIVAAEGMKRQIEQFMETVMKAERLDQ